MKVVLLCFSLFTGYYAFNEVSDSIGEGSWFFQRGHHWETDEIHFELMEYKHELVFSFDWDNMSEADIETAWNEIDLLLQEKAEELGITWTYEFGGHGYMYADETFLLYVEYKHELISSYEWDVMTEDELLEAKIEIKELLLLKAEELGIDFDEYKSGNNYGTYGRGCRRKG